MLLFVFLWLFKSRCSGIRSAPTLSLSHAPTAFPTLSTGYYGIGTAR
jgi:hypothetical protein